MTDKHHPKGAAAPASDTAPLGFDELGLSDTALSAVHDMGYEYPTPVQAQAIPLVLSGRDVMAAAQTGTGKTAAFLLPSLDRLGHAQHGAGPLMLVLTPTRELAQQIQEVAEPICRRTHHTAAVIVGGVGYEPQRKALRQGCDLLVATPGRLIDLINQGDCHLSQVEVLVLDEADRMLDMGFLPDMRKIVAQTPERRQTLLFSATLDDSVLDHTRSLVHDPERVEIARKGTTAETVEQYVLGVSREAKISVLLQLLEREGAARTIVFTNGKHRADHICRKLRKDHITCAPIHGDRTQNQRSRALKAFADGEVDVLVATDVLARGIDVQDVSYVINYDVPRDDPENYIHRIGRTGRAGEEGWSVTLVTDEDYLELRDVEKMLGRTIPPYPRTAGLDLGEHPFTPDPDRNPSEKLPSKKARKKMGKGRQAKAEKPQEQQDQPKRNPKKKYASEVVSQPETEARPEGPKPNRAARRAQRFGAETRSSRHKKRSSEKGQSERESRPTRRGGQGPKGSEKSRGQRKRPSQSHAAPHRTARRPGEFSGRRGR